MAQEMNESVAYLMALRQTAGHQGEAEAPKGPENHLGDNASLPTSEAGERFQGADKRRAPRYKCEGSAQVREEGCDVHTWVTFIDVSIHGCYVEAQATYPADTVLHMKLEANGFRVETKGRVRVSYPYLGMGIAFEDISEENMSQLKRMLATLSRRRSSWDRHRFVAAGHQPARGRTAHHRSASRHPGDYRILREPPDPDAG